MYWDGYSGEAGWGEAQGWYQILKIPNRHVGGSTEDKKHYIKIVRLF